jgi:hypothetical protein
MFSNPVCKSTCFPRNLPVGHPLDKTEYRFIRATGILKHEKSLGFGAFDDHLHAILNAVNVVEAVVLRKPSTQENSHIGW